MDVQVAESGPCRRTLTIKIPPAKVDEVIAQVFKAAAHQVDLKGFRKGKVPRSVLEKKYGPSIYAEAKEHLVKSSVSDACREHELVTVGSAKIDGIDESPLEPGTAVEFQVHLDIRPEIELEDVTGIEITAQPSDVTDEDMEQALKDLAGQKRTLETIDDAVGDSDFAKVDMTFKSEDGGEVSKREGVQINPNIPVAGTDPEQFKSQLVGAEKGSTITFDLTFPDTFEQEAVRGQKGTVEVEVHDVLRVQDAAIDDELAKSFEFDSVDAMQDELRKQIGQQKEANEKNRQVDEILTVILNDHPFDLPESLVDDEQQHGLKQFEERMRNANVGDEEIQQKLEEAQEPSRQDAERRVRMFFLLDAIAQKHEIGIEPADVEVELQRIAAQHQASIEEVRSHFEKDDSQASQLRMALLERKVRDFLRENAKISDN